VSDGEGGIAEVQDPKENAAIDRNIRKVVETLANDLVEETFEGLAGALDPESSHIDFDLEFERLEAQGHALSDLALPFSALLNPTPGSAEEGLTGRALGEGLVEIVDFFARQVEERDRKLAEARPEFSNEGVDLGILRCDAKAEILAAARVAIQKAAGIPIEEDTDVAEVAEEGEAVDEEKLNHLIDQINGEIKRLTARSRAEHPGGYRAHDLVAEVEWYTEPDWPHAKTQPALFEAAVARLVERGLDARYIRRDNSYAPAWANERVVKPATEFLDTLMVVLPGVKLEEW